MRVLGLAINPAHVLSRPAIGLVEGERCATKVTRAGARPMASGFSSTVNVRFGSEADLAALMEYVRLVPEADIASRTIPSPLTKNVSSEGGFVRPEYRGQPHRALKP